jgi:hypothetical protein
MLIVKSAKNGDECPWPWRLTNKGNMRYTLPGYLLFSPWPRNLYRFLRNCRNTLQQIGLRDGGTKARENESDFLVALVPDRIFQATQRAQRLIRAMKDFQGLAMPDSIAALDRWSNEPRRDTNISLRISQGTLVYDDGSERCEIEIPDVFTNHLSVPSAPDRILELHYVRAGGSYFP